MQGVVLDDYGAQKIGCHGDDLLAQIVLAILSPPGYRVKAVFFQMMDQAGYVFGIVLQVPVHGDDVFMTGGLDSSVQGCGLAEVAPQADIFYRG